MSESFQLRGLPCSSNLFFPSLCTFILAYLAFFVLLSIKGYTIFWIRGSGDSWMQDVISWDGLGILIPLEGMASCCEFKTILPEPSLPYSKVLPTWLEWSILGLQHSHLQGTDNHRMVGRAWKQYKPYIVTVPVNMSEFKLMITADLDCFYLFYIVILFVPFFRVFATFSPHFFLSVWLNSTHWKMQSAGAKKEFLKSKILFYLTRNSHYIALVKATTFPCQTT